MKTTEPEASLPVKARSYQEGALAVAEHRLAIDHLFMFIEPGGPEIAALQRLGLQETYRRTHPGQGTANVCFAFDNLYRLCCTKSGR